VSRASSDPVAFGRECEQRARQACDERDWHGIYLCAKSWIVSGGGGRQLDPWLLYVVSALMHGQPRTGVRSLDLALGNWISDPADRAVLLWTRAEVIHNWLRDPKTARADYHAALSSAPAWLRHDVEADLARCEAESGRSRKRKPSVAPAPDYVDKPRDFVTPVGRATAGSRPAVWDRLVAELAARS
jgi:hypothetical protein